MGAAWHFHFAPAIGGRAASLLTPGQFPLAIQRNRLGLERLGSLSRHVQRNFSRAFREMLNRHTLTGRLLNLDQQWLPPNAVLAASFEHRVRPVPLRER